MQCSCFLFLNVLSLCYSLLFRFVQDINKKYPGAGTQGPTKIAALWYRNGYYLPTNSPCEYFYFFFTALSCTYDC